MTEIEIRNTASFLDAARKRCPGFGKAIYWFRGHAQADWKLVPRVHREYDIIGERNLIARFCLAAPTRYADCPERTDRGGWLCLMQHWGLPTRLLDWTQSPLVALFFAASYDPKLGPGAVWVLRPDVLNDPLNPGPDRIIPLTGSNVFEFLNPVYMDGPAREEIVAVVGREVDLRMTVQQAAFTLHGSNVPLEARPGVEKYLLKFIIPEDAKANFAEELRFMGVRRATLFPDLANLASDLADEWRLIPKERVHENPAGLPGKDPKPRGEP